ncbi:flagellar biosynthesis protein FlhB [Elioraea sp.]|uniref:flagellar biosynthesis protein FlhB n=1 Tax=Elioraea sp. TaxID=2185103 RepID=UPI003F6FAB09
MAEEKDGNGEKTEAPTPRRLEKAREDGEVPVSKDLATAAALAGATIGAAMVGPDAAKALIAAIVVLFERAHTVDPALMTEALWPVLRAAALLLIGIAAFALALGAGTTLAQTRLLVSAKRIAPKRSRLSPLAGAKRIVSPENLMEFVKSLAKLSVLIAAAVAVLWDAPSRLLHSAEWAPSTLLAVVVADAFRLLLALLAALTVIGVLDVAWSRYRHAQRLRMSRQDIREEMKQSEGDPEIRARLRRIRAERSRNRMLAAVPKSTVVITNPTHYAVALAYDRDGSAAPKVMAKGVDHLAAKIRASAEEHRIPIVANPPLARALYTVEVDREIPEEHYQAVAEIIAYVWRLKGQVPHRAG